MEPADDILLAALGIVYAGTALLFLLIHGYRWKFFVSFCFGMTFQAILARPRVPALRVFTEVFLLPLRFLATGEAWLATMNTQSQQIRSVVGAFLLLLGVFGALAGNQTYPGHWFWRLLMVRDASLGMFTLGWAMWLWLRRPIMLRSDRIHGQLWIAYVSAYSVAALLGFTPAAYEMQARIVCKLMFLSSLLGFSLGPLTSLSRAAARRRRRPYGSAGGGIQPISQLRVSSTMNSAQ